MAETEKPTVKQKFTQSLPCTLGGAELAKRADELVLKMGERDDVEKALDDEKQRAKAIVTDLSNEISQLAREVRERREWRGVECQEEEDFAAGLVRVVRLDTGEPVRERAMTNDERQRGLFNERQKKKRGAPGDAPPTG